MVLLNLITWSSTINLGAIIILVFGASIALIFTIRSHVVATWKSVAEGEREEREQLQREFDRFKIDQQEIRHDLKNQLSECKTVLLAEQAKHDYSALQRAITDMHEAYKRHAENDAETFKTLVAQQQNGEQRIVGILNDVVVTQKALLEELKSNGKK